MWSIAILLTLAGGVLVRRRLRQRQRVTDQDIERLIRGEITALPGQEPPLDIGEIRAAEEDFWQDEAWRGEGESDVREF